GRDGEFGRAADYATSCSDRSACDGRVAIGMGRGSGRNPNGPRRCAARPRGRSRAVARDPIEGLSPREGPAHWSSPISSIPVESDFLDRFHFEQDIQLWFILPPNRTCNVHVHAGLTVGAIHGLDELADRHTWLQPKRTDDVDELDHTEAAFTAFIFGDE